MFLCRHGDSGARFIFRFLQIRRILFANWVPKWLGLLWSFALDFAQLFAGWVDVRQGKFRSGRQGKRVTSVDRKRMALIEVGDCEYRDVP